MTTSTEAIVCWDNEKVMEVWMKKIELYDHGGHLLFSIDLYCRSSLRVCCFKRSAGEWYQASFFPALEASLRISVSKKLRLTQGPRIQASPEWPNNALLPQRGPPASFKFLHSAAKRHGFFSIDQDTSAQDKCLFVVSPEVTVWNKDTSNNLTKFTTYRPRLVTASARLMYLYSLGYSEMPGGLIY